MKKYTDEEKRILLGTIGFYLYVFDRPENGLKEGPDGSPIIDLKTLKELYAKIILDVAPLRIKIQFNNTEDRVYCNICGRTFKPNICYWPFVDNIQICWDCLEQCDQESLKKAYELNTEYYYGQPAGKCNKKDFLS